MFSIYRLFKPLLIVVLYFLSVSVGIESVGAETKNIKVNISYKPKVYEQLNVKKFKLNHPIKISKRGLGIAFLIAVLKVLSAILILLFINVLYKSSFLSFNLVILILPKTSCTVFNLLFKMFV